MHAILGSDRSLLWNIWFPELNIISGLKFDIQLIVSSSFTFFDLNIGIFFLLHTPSIEKTYQELCIYQ